MTKRETIQRVRMKPSSDGQGGQKTFPEYLEYISVNVSIGTLSLATTDAGVRSQTQINVVSNLKLDDYIHTRYKYGNKLYKLMHQVKRGNEYFSTLHEVNE